MKILDLRPLLIKRFARSDQRPTAPDFWGKLAGFVADRIVKRRVSSRPSPGAGPLLVAVGNLALGGTGKTPMVMAIAGDMAARGITGAVLTRGYGSQLTGPLIVQQENIEAGDEARMMAGQLDEFGWVVVQSRNRPEGLAFLNKAKPQLRMILLEDAFQTNGLPRHIDLLILDSWQEIQQTGKTVLTPSTGNVFPFGPWRESAQGAARATALLGEGGATFPSYSAAGQPAFSFGRTVNMRQVHGPVISEDMPAMALVSGIARPEKFEASVMNILGKKAVLSIRCRDHENFGTKLVDTIVGQMNETGAGAMVTTAKDWVKLSHFWEDPRPVMVLDLELMWHKKDAFNHWLVERVNKLETDQSGLTAP